MARQLVITADDYGFSVERNEGILEAYRNKAVTNASLLLNCTGTEQGIKAAQKAGLTLGLHLNLTEGEPVGQKEYNTLTVSGIFRGMNGTRQALNDKQIDIEEVEKEISAQIEKFTKLCGQKPAYVDGHQHIHTHPVVAPIFAAALKHHGIDVTRVAKESNISSKTWLTPEFVQWNTMFVEEATSSLPVFKMHQISTTDCFTGLCTMGSNMTTERLQKNILEAFEAVEKQEHSKVMTCELMTHPGHPTPRNFGGFCWGTDDFGNSPDRVHEIKVLSSKEMKDFYDREKIVLVSHHKIPRSSE